jgi:hypothetical protein
MAGRLIQVDTETVTSAVGYIDLTGINTDDVYMVTINNCAGTADANFNMRTTTSGSPDDDSQYDKASQILKASTNSGTTSDTDEAQWRINSTVGTDTNEQTNHIIFLYNFNKSSEYSFYTNESAKLNASGSLEGYVGGGAHTVTEANDGVYFFFTSGNIESGTFTLYKVI